MMYSLMYTLCRVWCRLCKSWCRLCRLFEHILTYKCNITYLLFSFFFSNYKYLLSNPTYPTPTDRNPTSNPTPTLHQTLHQFLLLEVD